MRRRITIALLALGTIAGYGSGFASMRCRAESRRAAFERHVASLCVNAARDAEASSPAKAGAPRAAAADIEAPR